MRFHKHKSFDLRALVIPAIPEPASIKDTPEDNPADDKPCLINKLPPEILAYIFTLGRQMQLNPESYSEDMVETASIHLSDLEDEGEGEESGDENADGENTKHTDSDKPKAIQDEDTEEVVDDDGDSNFEDVDSIPDDSFFPEDFDDTDDDSEDDWEFPFQVLVAQVCRRWQQVAHSTPALWTLIVIEDNTDPEKVATWLSRSGGLPLVVDINLCMEDEETAMKPFLSLDDDDDDDDSMPLGAMNFDGMEIQLEQSNPLVAASMTRIRRSAWKMHQALLRKMQTFLKLVTDPHLCRWRDFSLFVPSHMLMHPALEYLSNSFAHTGGPKLLENLSLGVQDDVEDFETFEQPELRLPYRRLFGNAPTPNLHIVSLWGVHVDWAGGIFTNLVDLELTYLSFDVRPTFAQFRAILETSPNLESLSLCCAGPARPGQDETWGDASNVISLPSLRHFVLVSMEAEYATALIDRLYIPDLKNLIIELEDSDYSEFLTHLCSPLSNRFDPISSTLQLRHQEKTMLTTVETLTLNTLHCSMNACRLLYRSCINVKTLRLVAKYLEPYFSIFLADPNYRYQDLESLCVSDTDKERLEKFARNVIPCSEVGLGPEPFYFPNLEVLQVSGLRGDLLRAVLDRRGLHKAKYLEKSPEGNIQMQNQHLLVLDRLLIDHSDTIDPEDLIWFQKHTRETKYYTADDDDSESEFSDDEETGPHILEITT